MRELIGQLLEQDVEDVFKPATAEDLKGRKEQLTKYRLAKRSASGANWKIDSLAIVNPISGERSGMWNWWKNNKEWKERGIQKVDDKYSQIIFTFTNPMAPQEASELVRDFVQDWATKPSMLKGKKVSKGDMVYIVNPDYADEDYRYPIDSGRVTAVELPGLWTKARVRFHHHGTLELEVAQLIYNREHNSWMVPFDQTIRDLATAKKGTPEEGDSLTIQLPKGEQQPGRYQGNITYGKIDSVADGFVTMKYHPPKENWNEPEKPLKTAQIAIADLYYDGRHKKWIQKGLTD